MSNDERTGAELRHLMLTIDVPASRADVHRAVTDGQRAIHRRTAMLTAAAAGVAVLATAGVLGAVKFRDGATGNLPALSPPSAAASAGRAAGCEPTRLTGPDGQQAEATAIDPTGRIVGGTTGAQRDVPVIWKDGRAERLSGVQGVVVDIGADGSVLGWADDGDAWVWRSGQVTHLAKLAGNRLLSAYAINGKGQVAGYAADGNLNAAVPVMWAADGSVHKLSTPAGTKFGDVTNSAGRDITEDGRVVGEIRGVPVVWTTQGVPLPLAPVGSQAVVSAVAGRYVYGAKVDGTPLRWDIEAATVTELARISDNGARAGSVNGDALLPGELARTVSRRVGLNGRADLLPGPGGEPAVAAAMSADGSTIVGVAGTAESHTPIVWTCR
ncbi:hypothetical protein [Dactylosporangium matsuzakiense]|uniref:Uncharacterized protein n=1 Tax=Dactylosporangium matsuzakiense TaxID=53360 RepID=A0A9W6NMS9_9ACTN|nr:hypothetical protein [Dactylosporangium matsuzakiense]GLL02262.1 hypothetical protein GCM10017581_040040 [Dactylosporangium matsuzakiense]